MPQTGIKAGAARHRYWGLKCKRCGNQDMFLETMEYETHFVDGHLNYRHLEMAITDHYNCLKCGRRVRPGWHFGIRGTTP
jgi:hypothetical protein